MGWRRLGLLGLAATLGTLAVAYHGADGLTAMPPVWPAIFALAAVLTTGVVIWPTHRGLYQLAGPTMIVGLLSRPAAVWVNWVVGYVPSGWSVVISVIVYSGLSFFLGWFWLDKVGPWTTRHRAGVLAKGD